MKRIIIAFAIANVGNLAATAAGTTPGAVEATRSMATMPLAFTANHGQWDQQVTFRANAGGATMWFTSNGATYQFTRTIPVGQEPCAPDIPIIGAPQSGRQTSRSAPDDVFGRHHQPDNFESIAIKASFIDANPNPQMVGLEELEYKCNYFIGNDPNQWHTDVPNYSAVVYEQIYDGIDLKYYGNGKQMEYDFIVSPGADFSQIQIQYEGAESISINENGELVVTTKWGEVVEQRPVIYQMDNNSRITVAGEYSLKGDNSFGFELGSGYNPALALVIDPVLSYSTYLGGTGDDQGLDIAVDASGATYVAGSTSSTDFPTLNPYQGTNQGGSDAFVTKLNSSGNSLVYSTYLGGSGGDYGYSIAVDASGAAYITGWTLSPDFPTHNAYQGTYQGSGSFIGGDAFVTKIGSSGNNLVYSTFLGGSGGTIGDIGRGIAVDASGTAYVTGFTDSPDFPTLNPYQGMLQGFLDVFVTKISSSGTDLIYSTYLGGSGSEQGWSIAVDALGAAYVAGQTSGTDFPILNPYQGDQGGVDAFVTKLSSFGDSLIYSTYLGGNGYDEVACIAVDAFGAAYVTGHTSGSDFPTLNPFQGDQGGSDAFVTKLSSSGNSLIYSTYLGGSGSEQGWSIAVDASGAAYVTGYTGSTDFPTVGAYQYSYQGGQQDAFVIKLTGSGSTLVYSTYLGSNSMDEGNGIAVDASGGVYVAGYTDSPDFPIEGAYQNYQGGSDAFVTKLNAQVTCCIATRGDVNSDGNDLDIVDLTTVADYLFGVTPPILCPEESDVNGDGSGLPDIVDLTFIVDWLFGVSPTLVACP